MIGFDRQGNQVDLGTYVFDAGDQPEHWRLVGEGHVMRVAVSFVPVLEETVEVSMPIPEIQAPPPEPEEYESAVMPHAEPEPVGTYLGACEHLPPMAGVGDRIYHTIDHADYVYSIHGWVRQNGPPFAPEDQRPEVLELVEEDPEPAPAPPVKKPSKKHKS